MEPKHHLILVDIDRTPIITGGAGAASWRLAFDELYGIPADIGQFTDTGMTDPDVGRQTFVAVLHRQPSRAEFARLLERRLHYLYRTVADSQSYRVLEGVEDLLTELIDEGYLLGIVTGNLEAAAHIKLHRAQLNRFFSFGGYGSDASDRGELTKIAISRACLVYGEHLNPDQCIAVGDTPHHAEGRTPRASPASGWPASTSTPTSSERAERTVSSLPSRKDFRCDGTMSVRSTRPPARRAGR